MHAFSSVVPVIVEDADKGFSHPKKQCCAQLAMLHRVASSQHVEQSSPNPMIQGARKNARCAFSPKLRYTSAPTLATLVRLLLIRCIVSTSSRDEHLLHCPQLDTLAPAACAAAAESNVCGLPLLPLLLLLLATIVAHTRVVVF